MISLLLSLVAHGTADFIVPVNDPFPNKNNGQSFLRHGITIFLLLLVCLQGYNWIAVLGFSFCITVSHLGIDIIGCWLRKRRKRPTNLTGFVMDQLLHLATILVFWQVIDLPVNHGVSQFYQVLMAPKTIMVFKISLAKLPEWPITDLLLILIAYIYVCWGGAILIRKILDCLDRKEAEPFKETNYEKTGRYIGILERMLILTMVLNNGMASVAFILTAKSIARFNELNDKSFAEYYLVGTLLSTVLAVCGGIMLRSILISNQ